MFIRFPYNIPTFRYLSVFEGSLLDFDHFGVSGSEQAYLSDSVPVGLPQTAGEPKSLHIRLENSGYNRHGKYILR
jgi:hypothetical protein